MTAPVPAKQQGDVRLENFIHALSQNESEGPRKLLEDANLLLAVGNEKGAATNLLHATYSYMNEEDQYVEASQLERIVARNKFCAQALEKLMTYPWMHETMIHIATFYEMAENLDLAEATSWRQKALDAGFVPQAKPELADLGKKA